MKTVTIRDVIIGEGIPKICVPIVGITQNDIIQETIKAATLDIDLIEWRADWYENCFDIDKVIQTLHEVKKAAKQTPIIFTFRTAKEGGEKEIKSKEYEDILCAVIESQQADIVDIELFTANTSLLKKAKEYSVYTIVSSHDFQKTPSEQEIITRLCHMHELGGDIAKIAVMPQNKKDVLTLLFATEQMQKCSNKPFITMSMGNIGGISRITGEIFGSAVTFGAAEKSSAPGQIEVKKLKQMLQIMHDIC